MARYAFISWPWPAITAGQCNYQVEYLPSGNLPSEHQPFRSTAQRDQTPLSRPPIWLCQIQSLCMQ